MRVFPLRQFINIVEAAAAGKPLPTKTFKVLWHVGSMDQQDKRDGSHEGGGLSISLHPNEWRKIARGMVVGDLWRCTKPQNKFLDYHRLSKTDRQMIEQWGLVTGLITSGSVWRYTWYDDEDETDRFFEFPTREQAEREADGDEEAVSEVPGGLFPTPEFQRRTRASEQTADFALLVTLFVEDKTEFDGVWWNDTLDPDRLSAPRGVIVPSKIKEWSFAKQESMNESKKLVGDNLYQAYELISEYVTYGQMRADGQFDEQFEALWQMLPRPKGSCTLYRVLSLPRSQADDLAAGGSITLRPRTFSSWTKSPKALGRLIAARRSRPDEVVVVVRKAVNGSDVVIDVSKFYKTNHFTDGYDEWGRYVQWEQEVIVRSHGPLVIASSDVERIAEDQPTGTPEPGDVVINTSGGEEEIEDVPNEQPKSQDGIFVVLVNGGERINVRSIGDGDWEEV